jgi:hypothetical protein
LVDDDGIWICCEDSIDQSILAPVFWQIHGLTIIPFRFPFLVKTDNHNRDVSSFRRVHSLLEIILLVFLFVANSTTTIVVSQLGMLLACNRSNLIVDFRDDFSGYASFEIDVDEDIFRTIEHGLSLFCPVPEVYYEFSVYIESSGTNTGKADGVASGCCRCDSGSAIA